MTRRAVTWTGGLGLAALAGAAAALVDAKIVVAVLGVAVFLAFALFALRTAVLLAIGLAPFTNLIGSWLHLGNVSVGGLLRDLALATIVFAWLLRTVRESRSIPLSPSSVVLVAYVALATILTVVSSDTTMAIYGLRNIAFYTSLFFVGSDLFTDDEGRGTALRVMIGALAAIAALGVAEVLTNGAALRHIGFTLAYGGQVGSRTEIGDVFLGHRRATAGVGNPLDFGFLCMLGVLLALGWQATRRPWDRALRAGAIAVCAVGTVASLSRSSWLATGVGLITMAVAGRDWRAVRALAVVGLVVLASLRLFPEAVYFERLFSRDQSSQKTTADRLAIYDRAAQFAARNPVGVGIGSQGAANRSPVGAERFTLDSYYMQLLGEGGPLLLASYVLLLGALGVELRRVLRSAVTADQRALASTSLAVLLGSAAANVTSSSMDSRIISIQFWFLMGITLAAPLVRPVPRTGQEVAL